MTLRASSALIMRRFLVSCSLFLLIYPQSFLVTSVRGIALEPTTSASMELGVMGFMNAALGFLFLAIVYLSSLIRPGLCDAARRYGQRESASIRGKCQPPRRHFLARREKARPHGKGSLRYNRPSRFP